MVSEAFFYPVPDLVFVVGGPLPGLAPGWAVDFPERLLGSGVQIVLQGFAFNEEMKQGLATFGYRVTL
jgi:hypothetical protein